MFDQPLQPVALTSNNIHNSPTVLLGPEHVAVAAGISLLSCIYTEIYDIAYVLPVNGGHLQFTGYADIGEYPQKSHRVAGPRECSRSRWNFVAILYMN